jgi:hypothetical protein
MASLSDLVSAGSLKPMGVLATVDRAPSDADDTLDVLYTTDAGSDADEKALRWASRGGTLPAEGDDVLLFLDSLGDPWGIVWPSGPTSDVAGSIAAVAAAHAFHVTVTSAQSLGGGNPIAWNAENVDTDNLRTGTPTSIVLPAGVWIIGASVRPDAALTAGAFVQALIQKDGVFTIPVGVAVQVSGATPPSVAGSGVVRSDGTNAVRVVVFTSNTASVFASATDGETCFYGARVGV